MRDKTARARRTIWTGPPPEGRTRTPNDTAGGPLRAGTARKDWTDQPLPCHDPATWHLFFPEHGGTSAAETADARALCATCPARVHCLAHALEEDERHGVWGGLSPAERADLRELLAALVVVEVAA